MAIKGTYTAPDGSAIRPVPDPAMTAETIALSSAQAAAFFLVLNERPKITGFPFITADADEPDGYSQLGTPKYGSIILGKDGADGTDGQLNEYTDAQGVKSSYRTVELEVAVVDAMDYNRKVVVTDIQGLDTPIIEYISNGGNDITITGVYNSTPGVAPLDFIFNLNSIFNATVPIPVTNYYLNLLGVYYIVIMPGTTMGQVRGEYSTQRFTIKALSVTPMTEMLP